VSQRVNENAAFSVIRRTSVCAFVRIDIQNGDTALNRAAFRGLFETVRVLIDARADLNVPNKVRSLSIDFLDTVFNSKNAFRQQKFCCRASFLTEFPISLLYHAKTHSFCAREEIGLWNRKIHKILDGNFWFLSSQTKVTLNPNNDHFESIFGC